MDEAQMDSSQDKDLSGEVMESIGESPNADEESKESHQAEREDGDGSRDPLYVQKRLKQQKRAHEREIRELHARMNEMQSQMQPRQQDFANNSYDGPQGSGIDEQIHKAVSYALNHRDQEERKAKEAQAAAHVNKQYQELHSHLDKMGDKYDDFDDVVRGQNTPFTTHIRDAALLLPKTGAGSAGEVLYRLGKNPTELERISRLHGLDQAAEMVKLSHALISGGESKGSQPRQLGNIKSNPVTNSLGITDKTSPGDIRAMMKAGKFK